MAKGELITEEGKSLKNQTMFDVLGTDLEDYIEVMFIDIDYQKMNQTPVSSGPITIHHEYSTTISPEIVKKTVELKKVPIKIEEDIDSITLHLQREYIEIIKELGLKNLEKSKRNDDGSSNFDIKLKPGQEYSIRNLITKLIYASNYIAAYGRIGPAQYVIASENTTDLMLQILQTLQKFSRKSFTIIENKEMDDETIILGRKNEFSQPGVLLVLNENSFSKIEYNEKGEKYVILNYAFAVVGFHPENQFLTLKIKKEN